MSTDPTIDIRMADRATAKGKGTIRTLGVGSCVVVTVYDPVEHVGGMIHAMLPQRPDKHDTGSSDAKYVKESFIKVVEEVASKGAKMENLQVKLVGGSRMFKLLSADGKGIGSKNIKAAKEVVEDFGLTIDSEDTGGTVGRSVELDLANGLVTVSVRM